MGNVVLLRKRKRHQNLIGSYKAAELTRVPSAGSLSRTQRIVKKMPSDGATLYSELEILLYFKEAKLEAVLTHLATRLLKCQRRRLSGVPRQFSSGGGEESTCLSVTPYLYSFSFINKNRYNLLV